MNDFLRTIESKSKLNHLSKHDIRIEIKPIDNFKSMELRKEMFIPSDTKNKKFIGFLTHSIVSFFNSIFKKFENFQGELLIRKFQQTGISRRIKEIKRLFPKDFS